MKSFAKLFVLILIISSCNQSVNPPNNSPSDTTISNLTPAPKVEEPVKVNRELFQGQELKDGERIVKLNWGMQSSVVHLSQDEYGGSGHYSSSNYTVPAGKKWVLLYANEYYTYNNGVVGVVPYITENSKVDNSINRQYAYKDNINLSRAKDENKKYYSGSTIIGISTREVHDTYGNCLGYKGEICFLEVSE